MPRDFVGVFDSGVGGISVLKELVSHLPHEDFHFFGDSANAPYGEKPADTVRALVDDIASQMIRDGAKALVIACNTATSTSAGLLREKYPGLPVVGVEPALKPAVEATDHGRVLVMATPVTLRLDKFQQLEKEYGGGSDVICVPCGGLAARIEQGRLEDPDLVELVEGLVGHYRGGVDGVVLGCTHYPFVKAQIREVLGDVPFFDGAEGTARQTRRLLEEGGLLREEGPGAPMGSVTFASSLDTPEELDLYRSFFAREID